MKALPILTIPEIDWCAQECERQKCKPVSVPLMCQALIYARSIYETYVVPPTFEQILKLGNIVEPKNPASYVRSYCTHFYGSYVHEPVQDAETIKRILYNMMDCWRGMSPNQVYEEFETAHPFEDGNGRVGAILYNWRAGTLLLGDKLQVPPEFKGEHEPKREEDSGYHL